MSEILGGGGNTFLGGLIFGDRRANSLNFMVIYE